MAIIARNIGAGGRRLRLLMGIVFMAIGVVGAAGIAVGGAPRGAVVGGDVGATAVGVLQARDHT